MASRQPITTAASKKPLVPRARPYKDYLTPLLHRSFTNAALTALAVCWLEACLVSNLSLFWSWFPLGINGIRTALFFISCLMIFLLRLTNLHLGRSTYDTPFERFWRTLLSRRALFAVLWYCLSAFMFSETYIFSAPKKAKLEWIDMGRSYERARLNERAVIFRTMFALLAVCQATAHLYFDIDAIVLPFNTRSPSGDSLLLPPSATQLPLLSQVQHSAQKLAVTTLAPLISAVLVGPFIYFAFLRLIAWDMSYRVASSLFTIAKSSSPPGLSHAWALFGRFLWSATLLVILWQVTNFTFTFYASREPLKKDLPLTNDAKDPNESLANGVKAKKPLPRSMALWELQIIAERYEDRRRSIYASFEKPTSTVWADIVNVTIAEVEAVGSSIAALRSPPPTAPQPAADTTAGAAHKARIAQPLRTDHQVFSNPPRPASALDGLATGVGALAKSIGQSPHQSSPVAQRARAMITSSTQSAAANTPRVSRQSRGYLVSFLQTPVGWPFRATFRRRLNRIVFGSPYSRAADIHHAVQAISKLIVCSLTEDNLGQVQKDIPRVFRALIKTTQDVQGLIASVGPHWSDVFFDQSRRAPEVEELLVTLKAGIEMIVMTFGEYGDALGIGKSELRVARELVGKGTEMTQR